MAAAGGQAHPVALNDVVAFVLQDPNLLGLVLRAEPATQSSIYALLALMLVCKSWQSVARLVLADAHWLAPFVEAAEGFLRKVPLLRQVPHAVLQNATNEDEENEELTAEHALVLGMRTYRSHAGVQEMGCKVLVELAGEDNLKAVVGAGGLSAVISAMAAHVGNACVQQRGCGALGHFAKVANRMDLRMHLRVDDMYGNSEWQRSVVALRHCGHVIRVVLTAMTAHVGHADVQKAGWTALGNLPIMDNMWTRNSHIHVVLSAMKAHAEHAGVQGHGCAALYSLTNINDNSSALNPEEVVNDNRTEIMDAGGIKVVLAAMRTHVRHVDVQMQGCQVLRNLANNINSYQTGMMREGGICAVLSAMTAHAGHVRIQGLGSQVLRILVGDNDNLVVMTSADSFQVVLSAMKTDEKDLHVQIHGFKVLATLACDNLNVVALMGADGIHVVLTAMAAHVEHAYVQTAGWTVLDNFAINGDNTKAVVGAIQIPVVLSAMTAHSGHEGVQEHGCAALHRLTIIDGRSLALRSQELVNNNPMEISIRVAVKAMMAHVAHADVQCQGCKLLRVLARKTANVGMIVGEGGIRVVLEAMRAHPEHAVLQQYACGALGVLGWSDLTLQKRIKDEGGVGVVEAAVKASGATSVGVYLGQTLLNKLARV